VYETKETSTIQEKNPHGTVQTNISQKRKDIIEIDCIK